MIAKDGYYEFTFGESIEDPAVVALAVSAHAPTTLSERQESAELFRKKIATDKSKQFALMANPKVKSKGDAMVVTASFRISNNLILLRRLILKETASLKIDVLLWPQFQAQYGALVNDIADSIQYDVVPAPSGSPP